MPKIKTICHVCGKEIWRWPYLIRASQGLSYCSSQCIAFSRKGISPPNKANLAGQRFGLLTVLKEIGSKKGHILWLCICDCGKTNEVTTGCLKSYQIQSCGCLVSRRGDNHPNWKQGYHISGDGYMEIPIPNSTLAHRYRAEHRNVMELFLGRKLDSREIIHHINGNKLDNRIENLAVMSRAEHASLHANT